MGPVILGINGDAFGHDQAVCVLADGEVAFAIEEERLTRNKTVHAFPYFSVDYALDYCNLKAADVDVVAFSWTFAPFTARAWYPVWKELRQRDVRAWTVMQAALELPLLQAFRRLELACSVGYIERDRSERLRLVQVPHHLAHMAAGYAESGFDECAVCVIDGTGEIETATGYHCRGGSWRRVLRVTYPDSLGLVYGGITQHLGYRICRDEYKVMALAALGHEDPALARFFRSLIALDAPDGFRIDRGLFGLRRWSDQVRSTYLTPAALQALGPARPPGERISEQHRNIARALQNRTEEAILNVLRVLYRRTRARHLVLTGGVALNSVCNGKILAETEFDSIFVPAAPSDAGTAIGAALLAEDRRRLRSLKLSPYLGPEFSHADVEQAAARTGMRLERTSRPEAVAAERILAGDLVGWFQGRMEFGPRALGNRSILAEPGRASVRDRLNAVKGREAYRPFGISVPEHRASEVCRRLRQSPRMMMVDTVTPDRPLDAVRHADGTTRLHTLARTDNPRFYALLDEVHARSGLPGVLNTSFNTRGEPIVCSPDDALRTFATSQLDLLCMGDLVVHKQAGARRPSRTEDRTDALDRAAG